MVQSVPLFPAGGGNTYSFTAPIDASFETGTWHTDSLTLVDNTGRITPVTEAQLAADGFLTTVDVKRTTDATPPTITAYNVSPATMDMTTGPVTGTWTATATDDMCQPQSVQVGIISPTGSRLTISLNRDGATSYRSVALIPATVEAGIWTTEFARVTDNAGNATQLDTAALEGLGGNVRVAVSRAITGTTSAGGTVSTGTTASQTVPVTTAITTPVAGTITVKETFNTTPSPTGYALLGQQIDITAPAATVANPLVMRFEIAAALLAGADPASIEVFRDGAAAGNCPGSTTASPDPCVSSRTVLGSGNVQFTVLSSHASAWNFGQRVVPLIPFSGYSLPASKSTNAGATVPIRFSLDGNRGLDVVAAGYPQSMACGSAQGEATSSVEGLRLAGEKYQYNWQTAKAWAGTCRQFVIKLVDGSTHTATFQFH